MAYKVVFKIGYFISVRITLKQCWDWFIACGSVVLNAGQIDPLYLTQRNDKWFFLVLFFVVYHTASLNIFTFF